MSGKPIEERAFDATQECDGNDCGGMTACQRHIERALQAEHEQAVEEACKAVCQYCDAARRWPGLPEFVAALNPPRFISGRGWMHSHVNPKYQGYPCEAEAIRRALAPEKGE